MKNRLFLLLVIIAVVGIAVVLNYGKVWAQQEGPPEPFDSAKCMIPVEFSDSLDRSAPTPPGGGPLVLDAEQNLYTEPPDLVAGPSIPWDTYDFDGVNNPSGDQVDALANPGDYLFHGVMHNRASLLVSFRGDPLVGGIKVAVFMETPPGVRGPKWTQHVGPRLYAPVAPDPPPLNDVDALEVWGPRGSDDANLYSLIGDPGGVSVFCYHPGTGASTPYIFQPIIQAAVENLGYEGPTVDLDGLMAFENGGIHGDSIWNAGDTIIFSIKANANWHGGEIVVLGWNAIPGAGGFFLFHGGHLWDNTPANRPSVLFGVPRDDVDGIEAYPYNFQSQTPTLTQWGLIILVILLISSGVFIMLMRRKAAVPA